MSPNDFEQQVQDELRTTENLIYYLTGRRETTEKAGLEQIQARLERNYELIVELYRKLSSKSGGKK